MESPDVVDTSDIEEREVFTVSDDAVLWTSPASTPTNTLRPRVLLSPQSTLSEKVHQRRPGSLLTLMTRHDRYSDHEVENPSPRKRIKVCYVPLSPFDIDVLSKIAHNASPGSASSITAEAPRRPPKVTLMPRSPSQRSLDRMLVDDDGEQPSISLPRDVSPHSDWHSLFSSPSRLSAKSSSPDATSRVRPQSVGSPPTSHPLPHSLPRSLSVSTGHYSPFSPPHHRPTTPPQTSSQRSHDPPSSAGRKRHLVTSSPLTPVSSPAFLARTGSQSPDPLLLSALRPPRSPHLLSSPSNLPPRVHSPPAGVPEDPQPLGRYSLRRREARQLNPYAYDKLLYKQQLKSHPDAIVKFRGPGRRPSSGEVGEDGTQDAFVFPLDNPDEDGDYVDVEDESGRRRRRRVQNFDRHDMTGEETRQVEEGWLPKTLKELSSSDEDDNEIRKMARSIRREREKAEALARADARRVAAEARQAEIETRKATKRRPKPFPVHGDAEHGSTVGFLMQHLIFPKVGLSNRNGYLPHPHSPELSRSPPSLHTLHPLQDPLSNLSSRLEGLPIPQLLVQIFSGHLISVVIFNKKTRTDLMTMACCSRGIFHQSITPLLILLRQVPPNHQLHLVLVLYRRIPREWTRNRTNRPPSR